MKHEATVTRVVREAPHISTVFFTINGGNFSFTAGQYISVYFEQTGKRGGKAYSLSSSPRDDELSITVKNVGEYSGLICALTPGDRLMVSAPFGYFNVKDGAPIVAIAAGVGIAPIWSIIRDELVDNPERQVSLFLTAPYEDELVFHAAIETLFDVHSNAKAHYFVTREESDAALSRRLSVDADVSPALLTSARFYICGSEAFVRAMWIQLMTAGVQEQRVVTETFFESSL